MSIILIFRAVLKKGHKGKLLKNDNTLKKKKMKKKRRMKMMMMKRMMNLIQIQERNLKEKGGLRKKTMKRKMRTKKILMIIASMSHQEKHQKILLFRE